LVVGPGLTRPGVPFWVVVQVVLIRRTSARALRGQACMTMSAAVAKTDFKAARRPAWPARFGLPRAWLVSGTATHAPSDAFHTLRNVLFMSRARLADRSAALQRLRTPPL
jgi:hypothetical protein